MKKLNRHIKDFIKRSINDLGIHELKFFIEEYGHILINRVLKLIEYLRKKEKLILRYYYKNCTRSYSNYYNYSHDQLLKFGYIFKNGFYCKYHLNTIH